MNNSALSSTTADSDATPSDSNSDEGTRTAPIGPTSGGVAIALTDNDLRALGIEEDAESVRYGVESGELVVRSD